MEWEEIREIAIRLRNKPTKEEQLLWQIIRNRNLAGRKFLRQHPLIYDANRLKNDFFFFIPDFYCAAERLVIELDGPIHDFQAEKDYNRDMILQAQHLKVLRIKNEELRDMDSVISKITGMFDL